MNMQSRSNIRGKRSKIAVAVSEIRFMSDELSVAPAKKMKRSSAVLIGSVSKSVFAAVRHQYLSAYRSVKTKQTENKLPSASSSKRGIGNWWEPRPAPCFGVPSKTTLALGIAHDPKVEINRRTRCHPQQF